MLLVALALLSACSLVASTRDEVAGQPQKFSPSGTKVASLTVEAATGQSASLVLLSNGQPPYSMQADTSGSFSIRQGDSDLITISKDGDLVARTHMLAAGALSAATGVYVQDTMQWALVVDEEFSRGQTDWKLSHSSTKVTTTQCRGGLHMLGGFQSLAKASVQKTFKGLPPHNKVRVTATFHFIDSWNGETAFMRASLGQGKDLEYVWTERYDISDYRGTIDCCGAELGEGRFSSPIDVTLAHTSTELTVQFGSTLNLPAAASRGFYGVSSVQVFVRA